MQFIACAAYMLLLFGVAVYGYVHYVVAREVFFIKGIRDTPKNELAALVALVGCDLMIAFLVVYLLNAG